ncbi:MAG: hypothetical protein II527_02510 [Bacteroidales bacterium]|nr:hypothetical protein [Bacteroidales bacterium]MBQ1883062.1 hypothetical protein [Bacteroidales bacterium]MBQ2482108.1 hypothetical protein [Bacteroidales bacterium]MBQ2492188.1 hypothetical protein [Bacteroidales bacterium]MBQ4197403.1 hypothetical protein [Bacteroidales bacterium]
MGFKFFHLPEHRVFDYPSRYYNKDLEKFEGINAEIKASESGKEYVPGSIVSKGFRKPYRELKRADGGYGRGKRYVVYILIAVILVALLYFTKALHLLFQAYQINHQ